MARLSATRPFVHEGAKIVNSTFGGWCEVGAGSIVVNSAFEDYAYCDRLADIANTVVGKFANIAAMTRIGPTDHPYENDAPDDPAFFAARAARRTSLGADCWIGHGAIIKPEITVGIGAIVAAGAVVTKDVAPFTIVAGCPANVIRKRFSDDVIERLLALAWWDWTHEALREALLDFRTLKAEAFLKRYKG